MNKIASILIVVLVLVGAGYLVFKNKVGEVSIPNSEELPETTEAEPLTGFTLPKGFAMSIYADNIAGARDLELDPKGRILVSQTEKGKISAVWNTDSDPAADEEKVLAAELNKPHGLAMNCGPTGDECFLYVAEQGGLSRYPYNSDGPSLGTKERLIPFNSSNLDRHFTRSLLFLPSPNENTLLISIGSSCDVCNEKETDYATIISYDIATKKQEVYAKGLRNSVFMTLDPVFGKVFATEMGRDNLGDNLPPDEINIIEQKNGEPKNYGWPICYGKNIHDTDFDNNTYIRNPCMEPFETPSFVDLQAHSAPLGLAFIPEEGYAEDWWYDLLVAYHGSWNRSAPTGYKIVRLKMDAKGNYSGTEDFITGWLTADGKKLGRPVDIMVLSGGTMYISDDESGVVYRVARTQ